MPQPVLLIVQTEQLSISQPGLFVRVGDMDAMFRDALAGWPGTLRTCNVAAGEPLPNALSLGGTIAGAVITGASAMVDDPHPWIAVLSRWVRSAIAHGVPLLGVCFGHQLIARALGGHVVPNRTGAEYKTVQVALAEAARGDALFAGMPASFPAQAAHFQTVDRLPAGAAVLATGVSGIHGARFAEACWGVQFHPEFTPDTLLEVIDFVAGHIDDEAAHLRLIEGAKAVRATPDATAILARFGNLAADRWSISRKSPQPGRIGN